MRYFAPATMRYAIKQSTRMRTNFIAMSFKLGCFLSMFSLSIATWLLFYSTRAVIVHSRAISMTPADT